MNTHPFKPVEPHGGPVEASLCAREAQLSPAYQRLKSDHPSLSRSSSSGITVYLRFPKVCSSCILNILIQPGWLVGFRLFVSIVTNVDGATVLSRFDTFLPGSINQGDP